MTGGFIDHYRGEERRRAPRTPLCLRVAAESDAWMGLCHTRDLSESGAFLICQRLPSVQTGFSVEIDLPGDLERLRLGAMVVRVQDDLPRGFGITWKSQTDEQNRRLRLLRERWERVFA